MKATTIVAIMLIAIGGVALGYHSISYKTQENVVDIGPLKVTTEATHTFPLPPIVGTLALAGGVVLLIIGRRKS